MGTKEAPMAIRFDVSPPSVYPVKTVMRTGNGKKEVHHRLIFLPLYLVERLKAITTAARLYQG